MRIVLTILSLIFLAVSSQAQWQLNGIAVCDTSGSQHVATNGILSDGDGGAFVVWGDNRNGWSIYAQHVDSSGQMLWGRQGKLICTAPGWQFAPRVAHDGEGGFVATWHDTRNDSRDVYAQRVDKYGNIIWNEAGVQVVHYDQFQGVEDILLASDSTFIIVWRDDRFFPDSSSINIQKITKDGLKLWQDDGIRVSNNAGSPLLVSDMKGGAFVLWAGENDDGILIQHVDKNGVCSWPFPGKSASIGNADWNDTDLSVCSDSYGGSYIAWDFDDTDNAYIQRIDSSGNRLWGDNGIQIISNEITQKMPTILNFHTDSVICMWQDNYNLRMQVFSKEGKKKFTPLGLRLTNYKTSSYISSVYYNNEILISHPEVTNFFPNEFIIKAQKTNSSGELYWGSDGVIVSNKTISPDEVRGFSVSDGTGGIITIWEDDRADNIETDIYIQRIYSNGRAGGDTTTTVKHIENLIPDNFNLKIYPNPFNNTVNIKFNLKKNMALNINVFDLNGRKIWEKNKEICFAGIHKSIWPAKNNQGKVVSTGIYFISVSGEGRNTIRKVLLVK